MHFFNSDDGRASLLSILIRSLGLPEHSVIAGQDAGLLMASSQLGKSLVELANAFDLLCAIPYAATLYAVAGGRVSTENASAEERIRATTTA
jgi:hypothetical protein